MGPRGEFLLLGLGVFAFLVGDSRFSTGWFLVCFWGVVGVRIGLLGSGSSGLMVGSMLMVVVGVNEGKE